MRSRAVLPLLFVLAACQRLPQDDERLVTKLRVLDVQASPPEAVPGQVVWLNALVAAPSERPWKVRWYTCDLLDGPAKQAARAGGANPFDSASLDSGVGPGGATPCIGSDTATFLGEGTPLLIMIPANFLDNYGDRFTRLAGLRLTLHVRASDGVDESVAVKRVTVSLKGVANITLPSGLVVAPNQNPGISEIAVKVPVAKQNEILLVHPGQSILFQAVPAPDAGESYATLNNQGELAAGEEQLRWSFFNTAGSFGGDAQARALQNLTPSESPEVTWTAPSTVSPGTHLFFLLRDGRGGTGWRQIDIAPAP